MSVRRSLRSVEDLCVISPAFSISWSASWVYLWTIDSTSFPSRREERCSRSRFFRASDARSWNPSYSSRTQRSASVSESTATHSNTWSCRRTFSVSICRVRTFMYCHCRASFGERISSHQLKKRIKRSTSCFRSKASLIWVFPSSIRAI